MKKTKNISENKLSAEQVDEILKTLRPVLKKLEPS